MTASCQTFTTRQGQLAIDGATAAERETARQLKVFRRCRFSARRALGRSANKSLNETASASLNENRSNG
jgi:hypothetical protein